MVARAYERLSPGAIRRSQENQARENWGVGRSRSKKGEVEDWSVVRLLSHGSKNIAAPGGFSAHGQGCAPLHTSTTAAPLGEDVEVVEDGGYRQWIQFRW